MNRDHPDRWAGPLMALWSVLGIRRVDINDAQKALTWLSGESASLSFTGRVVERLYLHYDLLTEVPDVWTAQPVRYSINRIHASRLARVAGV